MVGDYYALFGISRTASSDQIKQAYRTKIMEYHPDRLQIVMEQKTKELNEAYSVLTSKKWEYDTYQLPKTARPTSNIEKERELQSVIEKLRQDNRKMAAELEELKKAPKRTASVDEFFERLKQTGFSSQEEHSFVMGMLSRYVKYGNAIKMTERQAEWLENIAGMNYPGKIWTQEDIERKETGGKQNKKDNVEDKKQSKL